MYAAGGAGRRSCLHWEREYSSCIWASTEEIKIGPQMIGMIEKSVGKSDYLSSSE